MKKKLGLIYGGKSGEHEVSIQTAYSILNAINYNLFTVTPIYITVDGFWIKGEETNEKPTDIGAIVFQNKEKSVHLFDLKKELDVVFPVVHGPNGEDGTLQGLLEMLDIPYVGCGVVGSSIGMDKVLMKKIFKAENLPQCNFLYYRRNEIEKNMEKILLEIEEKIHFPCFVKPANLGSSVGITKAKDMDTLKKALLLAAGYDNKVIVEENVVGREVEIGILGNEELETSVIGEVVTTSDFYDYEAKYQNTKATQIQIPAELPNEIEVKIHELAKKAFKALDGIGLARMDFFYLPDREEVYLNEINTMPGFTPYSMYPTLFKKAGIEYDKLIEKLVDFAIEQYRSKKLKMIKK